MTILPPNLLTPGSIISKVSAVTKPQAGFHIDSIVAQISRHGVARPQYYKVSIGGTTPLSTGAKIAQAASTILPNAAAAIELGGTLIGALNGSSPTLPPSSAPPEVMMNCSAVSVGGFNIEHTPEKRFTIGTATNYATGKTFTEATMTFYESEFENEREFFVQWMSQIYNRNTKRFGFFKNYVKNIVVDQYNRQSNVVYQMTMKDCYPTAISTLERGYSLDAPATFTVAFQLVDIEEQYYTQGSPLTLLGGTVGEIVDGTLGGQIGEAITGLSSTTPTTKI